MKPLIGITTSIDKEEKRHSVNDVNVQAILRAGGIPVLLPNIASQAEIEALANKIDGLYSTGGYDLDPLLFGEEPHRKLGTVTPPRDKFEMTIAKKILELDKPFLGVCRGAQVMNVAASGTLFQDIDAQSDNELLQHGQKSESKYATHFVDIEKDSLLADITGEEKIRVNSFHHQACKDVVSPFIVSAKAADGIVEAIESKDHKFALGLQWHPESMLVLEDEPSLKIYDKFIEACNN